MRSALTALQRLVGFTFIAIFRSGRARSDLLSVWRLMEVDDNDEEFGIL